jgi:hypothetical protein
MYFQAVKHFPGVQVAQYINKHSNRPETACGNWSEFIERKHLRALLTLKITPWRPQLFTDKPANQKTICRVHFFRPYVPNVTLRLCWYVSWILSTPSIFHPRMVITTNNSSGYTAHRLNHGTKSFRDMLPTISMSLSRIVVLLASRHFVNLHISIGYPHFPHRNMYSKRVHEGEAHW